MTVTVRNGRVVSVVGSRTGPRPARDEEAIDSLFQRMASDLGRPNTKVDVTYDSILGYPRRVSVTRTDVDDANYSVTLDSLHAIP